MLMSLSSSVKFIHPSIFISVRESGIAYTLDETPLHRGSDILIISEG
ncbi:uncharacterized, partial [Tachysurus ichikawai]